MSEVKQKRKRINNPLNKMEVTQQVTSTKHFTAEKQETLAWMLKRNRINEQGCRTGMG